MSKQLPESPSLEHLKNEAKALLRIAKAGGSPILPVEARLADAQRAVARDYGFPSWAKLKRFVEGYASAIEAFFAAIRGGDREEVKRLLAETPALVRMHDPGSFGAPPIVAAIGRKDRQMIDLLLEAGADVNARSTWWAGSFGALDFSDRETSDYLMSRGAILTAHAAARLGMTDELRQIIARDPSVVTQRGGDGQHPLHFAATPEIVDILVDAGAAIDARDLDHEGTPAQFNVHKRPILQRLVERGAALDVFSAVALNDVAALDEILARDPEAVERKTDEPGNPMIPQAPGWHIYTYNIGFARPYQAAVKFGSEEAFRLLFERSSPRLRLLASIWNADRSQALELAHSQPAMLEDIRSTESRLLIDAVKERRPEVVRVLLDLGFNVDVADGQDFTPVNWAGFYGFDDLIETILPYGPDLEKRNRYGGTALSCLMFGSSSDSSSGDYARGAELLIQAGAVLPERQGGSKEVRAVLASHGVPD